MFFFLYILFYIYLKILRQNKSKTKSKILSKIFINSQFKLKLLKLAQLTQSQLLQELFVINFLNFKRKGFFVEFGACDGIFFSNTLLLEKLFLWRGILAEPSKLWHSKLRNNRGCAIFYGAVTADHKKRTLLYENNDSALSGLYKNKGKYINSYSVKCLEINKFLKKFKAPNNIDYLSIDTEGNEYKIIKKLNFLKFRPKLITIEHNYRNDKNSIKKYLEKKNYKIFSLALTKYDMWFYDNKIINN
jgi:FkbM family methyltransferase